MNVGKDYGIRNAGYFALRSLRTEKFFAYWGTDLSSSITPLECSRDHRVKLSVSRPITVVSNQVFPKKSLVKLSISTKNVQTLVRHSQNDTHRLHIIYVSAGHAARRKILSN